MLAYFDCFSGISGDMTLGALMHLGVPAVWLKKELARMPLDGFDIQARPVVCHGISAIQAVVDVSESHHHRHYGDIQALLSNSHYSEWVKEQSLAVFDKIATAEGVIHGVPKAKVHFHEVGSMDAIVDIVGACLGMEYLGVDQVVCSPLPLGHGFVRCEHGTLPVPAPATLEILRGIPVHDGLLDQEMVTPTGAAIAATLTHNYDYLPAMQVEKIGYGAGTRQLTHQPNLLRIILGQISAQSSTEKLVMVETSIDDMNPEFFGYLMDKLFANGALDLHWVPVQMKKNRPGTLVQVLCRPHHRTAIVNCILAETTSLGVRFYDVFRTAVERNSIQVSTAFGDVVVKQVTQMDGSSRIIPEFEVCKQIAESKGLSLRDVYAIILRTADPLNGKAKV